MSDTQNKWIPVSERLPDKVQEKLVRTTEQEFRLAYVLNGKWRDADVCEDLEGVTHWMDLPEPPAPVDPFEAWWNGLVPYTLPNLRMLRGVIIRRDTTKDIWSAAQGKPEA